MAGYKRDYMKIAEQILTRGSAYQKKCVQWYKDNLEGEPQRIAIENFIRDEISLGKITPRG